jgi:hypothetical protein
VAGIFQDELFGGNFGFGINRQGVDGVDFDVIALAAVKYKVGGEKHEAAVGGQGGEVGGGIDIYGAGSGGIGLAIGAFGHRGAMEDELRAVVAEFFVHGGEIGQIQIGSRQGDNVELRGSVSQIMAD